MTGLLWLAGCVAPVLHYEPVDFTLGPDGVGDRTTLDGEVAFFAPASLDDVRLYDHVLSAAEVGTLAAP